MAPFPNFHAALMLAIELIESEPQTSVVLLSLVSKSLDESAYRGLSLPEADSLLNVHIQAIFGGTSVAEHFVGLSCSHLTDKSGGLSISERKNNG